MLVVIVVVAIIIIIIIITRFLFSEFLCIFFVHIAAAKAKAAAAAIAGKAKGKDGGGWSGHSGAVSGVAVDAVNKTMVSVGVDGLLVFWAFREKRADGAVFVGSGVSQLELVRGEKLDTGYFRNGKFNGSSATLLIIPAQVSLLTNEYCAKAWILRCIFVVHGVGPNIRGS